MAPNHIKMKCDQSTPRNGIILPPFLFPITAISTCSIPDNMNVCSYCRHNEMTCIGQILLCQKATALKLTQTLKRLTQARIRNNYAKLVWRLKFQQANTFFISFLTSFPLYVFFKSGGITQECGIDVNNARPLSCLYTADICQPALGTHDTRH